MNDTHLKRKGKKETKGDERLDAPLAARRNALPNFRSLETLRLVSKIEKQTKARDIQDDAAVKCKATTEERLVSPGDL